MASSIYNPTNGMLVDASATPSSPAACATNVVPEAAPLSVAEQVVQAVHPVLEDILRRIWDLERQVEGVGRTRATEPTPGPEHHTLDSRAVAPQSPGHVRLPRVTEAGHVPPCPAGPPRTSPSQVSLVAGGCAGAPTNPVRQQKGTSGVQPPEVGATPLADAPPPTTTAEAFPALFSCWTVVAAPVPTTFAGVLTAGGVQRWRQRTRICEGCKGRCPFPSFLSGLTDGSYACSIACANPCPLLGWGGGGKGP